MKLDSIATLRVDGRRLSPARYPNADPETQFWPIGYLTSARRDWLAPQISPNPNPATLVDVKSPNRDWDTQFSQYRGGINGTCSIYSPPFSYWCQSPPFSDGCGGCFTWNIPSGLHAHALTNRSKYTNPADAQLMAWRAAHWANWAFEVKAISDNGTVEFGRGGFQGARGGAGSDWFVQNVFEELDQANEYYYDRSTMTLFVVSNETSADAPPSGAFIAVPSSNHTLLTALGSPTQPIVNLTIRGIGFRDTAWTVRRPPSAAAVAPCAFAHPSACMRPPVCMHALARVHASTLVQCCPPRTRAHHTIWLAWLFWHRCSSRMASRPVATGHSSVWRQLSSKAPSHSRWRSCTSFASMAMRSCCRGIVGHADSNSCWHVECVDAYRRVLGSLRIRPQCQYH
jgi:hypothetical protein